MTRKLHSGLTYSAWNETVDIISQLKDKRKIQFFFHFLLAAFTIIPSVQFYGPFYSELIFLTKFFERDVRSFNFCCLVGPPRNVMTRKMKTKKVKKVKLKSVKLLSNQNWSNWDSIACWHSWFNYLLKFKCQIETLRFKFNDNLLILSLFVIEKH